MCTEIKEGRYQREEGYPISFAPPSTFTKVDRHSCKIDLGPAALGNGGLKWQTLGSTG